MSHRAETRFAPGPGWALLLILGGPACAPSEAELRGRVETLSHDAALCQAVAPAPRAEAPRAPVDAAHAFDLALSAYQEGATAQAFAAFSSWLQSNPGHAWADRARYWMGQTKFDLGEYAAAAEHFGQLPEAYPGSQKAPDALLQMGFAFERLHQDERATVTFAQLVAKYPRSASAELARSRLKATEARHARR